MSTTATVIEVLLINKFSHPRFARAAPERTQEELEDDAGEESMIVNKEIHISFYYYAVLLLLRNTPSTAHNTRLLGWVRPYHTPSTSPNEALRQ